MTGVHREELVRALPYARRYARALAGSQPRGDALVADALREIQTGGDTDEDVRLCLFRHVTRHFNKFERSAAPGHGLTTQQRQLLLLTALEDMKVEEAAPIVAIPPDDAARLLDDALGRLRAAAAADVLIIEDEPIIAMDIEELVAGCGHRVVGIAANEHEALDIATQRKPGLILADINLGSGGDGTAAVARILQRHQAPVIFVTAYPERLLTGKALEPAYVITKPFEPLTLAITTYQAVTGGLKLE